jgi:hypothetical protein
MVYYMGPRLLASDMVEVYACLTIALWKEFPTGYFRHVELIFALAEVSFHAYMCVYVSSFARALAFSLLQSLHQPLRDTGRLPTCNKYPLSVPHRTSISRICILWGPPQLRHSQPHDKLRGTLSLLSNGVELETR